MKGDLSIIWQVQLKILFQIKGPVRFLLILDRGDPCVKLLNSVFDTLSLRDHLCSASTFKTGHSIQFENFEKSCTMPSKRRKRSPTDDRDKSKRPKTANSRRGLNTTFSSKLCKAWFREYTSSEENLLGPEGMEKFCEDIGVEPENIVMLALAWKLQAQNMGFFKLEEWMNGMTELQCDCIGKLQDKLDYLRSLLNDPATFKSIFRFAFDFAKEENQRSLDMDTAKIMLTLLLGGQWPLQSSFTQFLEQQQGRYKVINKDQWCNVLEFSRSIHPDLSNYDEDGAWPVMLDEFVDWLKEQRGLGDSGATAS